MANKRVHDEGKQPARERRAGAVNLIELRPGFFLNADQIVSVRVLAEEEGDVYALLQLSNGDKLNLTGDEFAAVTGDEPRAAARLRLR